MTKTSYWGREGPRPHFEGRTLIIPCAGQGLDNGIDPVPCGCILRAEMPPSNHLTNEEANKIMAEAGWHMMVRRIKKPQADEVTVFSAFCNPECQLAWTANHLTEAST